ncbi:hypothetical protein HELRODRAFT_181524 [Helobdella robusta]|uniref:Uncharacterized protein n=1 Tax=Helobdella robusta TaxID=6412 RepID=T1FH30_HELRO|nr:hypothetical protein HELRODRAFT_181524 [Helobdella robusta]ESN92326.1 hypothetical protein HELRODRAFT_181524 [Helobdella robusta]
MFENVKNRDDEISLLITSGLWLVVGTDYLAVNLYENVKFWDPGCPSNDWTPQEGQPSYVEGFEANASHAGTYKCVHDRKLFLKNLIVISKPLGITVTPPDNILHERSLTIRCAVEATVGELWFENSLTLSNVGLLIYGRYNETYLEDTFTDIPVLEAYYYGLADRRLENNVTCQWTFKKNQFDHEFLHVVWKKIVVYGLKFFLLNESKLAQPKSNSLLQTEPVNNVTISPQAATVGRRIYCTSNGFPPADTYKLDCYRANDTAIDENNRQLFYEKHYNFFIFRLMGRYNCSCLVHNHVNDITFKAEGRRMLLMLQGKEFF